MIANGRTEGGLTSFYVLGSRPLTHIIFWVGYYIVFSLIWMRPEQGYFASFYLEFVLMPFRIGAVYAMLYILIPRYLIVRRYREFLLAYLALLLLTGFLQRLSSYFFYEFLLFEQTGPFIDLSLYIRSIMLVNTTVILLGAVKIFSLYLLEVDRNQQRQMADGSREFVEVKANRRTYLLQPSDILYLESMGNYVTYFLANGEKLVSYGSIKAALDTLPEEFLRLHRSYVVNLNHLHSYNADNVIVAGQELPRGKDIEDAVLVGKTPV